MDRAREAGREQPWRLPLTSLRLSPRGAQGSEVTYQFRLQWAPDFQGVRDALYAGNQFDTVVVPGMTLPSDLPAMIALRTRNKIDAVEAEFPANMSGRLTIAARGQSFSQTVVVPKGEPSNFLTEVELRGKFTGLADTVLGAERAGRLADAVLAHVQVTTCGYTTSPPLLCALRAGSALVIGRSGSPARRCPACPAPATAQEADPAPGGRA